MHDKKQPSLRNPVDWRDVYYAAWPDASPDKQLEKLRDNMAESVNNLTYYYIQGYGSRSPTAAGDIKFQAEITTAALLAEYQKLPSMNGEAVYKTDVQSAVSAALDLHLRHHEHTRLFTNRLSQHFREATHDGATAFSGRDMAPNQRIIVSRNLITPERAVPLIVWPDAEERVAAIDPQFASNIEKLRLQMAKAVIREMGLSDDRQKIVRRVLNTTTSMQKQFARVYWEAKLTETPEINRHTRECFRKNAECIVDAVEALKEERQNARGNFVYLRN